MQVKPRFKKYKIVEQHFILTDDTGNEMCLTLFDVELKNGDIEESKMIWEVVGKRQERWDNGAISYDNVAYWKSDKKELFNGIINGFNIREIENGGHNMFSKEKGLRTAFIVSDKNQVKC